jgi:NAD(P)H-hydrate epimerase
MSRLTELPVADVQADRLGVAVGQASRWGTTVILKGAHTVVAAPDGRARISPFANPALASGGTGDVLAGAVVGLVAQGLEPFDAAAQGVYLHGRAGEKVRRELGEAGLLASDLLPNLPLMIKEIGGR